MKKTLKRLTAMLLSLLLAMPLFSFSAIAAGSDISDAAPIGEMLGTRMADTASVGKIYLKTKSVASKNIWSHSRVTVVHNQRALTSDARRINGVTYIALRASLVELNGMKVTYDSRTRTLSATGGGLTLSAADGSNIVYANGRVLFSEHPNVIMTNGRMYIPLTALAKAMRLSMGNDGGTRVTLSGTPRAIISADRYYAEDAVYWLSRIISAESRGEPILGQIAVGNVVLNRVKSSAYPNTVWGVIFDKKYGVQFSPVSNGSIYASPADISVLAAKICLEGYTVSNSALFFIQPRTAHSSWIQTSRKYLFTIQNHDFYA